MKTVSCRSCQNHRTVPKIRKNNFLYYQCQRCQIIFLDQNEKYEDFVKRFYTAGYFTGEPKFSAYDDYQKNKTAIMRNFLPIISEIKKYRPLSGKHLDIGCAYGYLLKLSQSYGFTPVGIEPSEFAAEKAQKIISKKAIISTTFEEAQLPFRSFSLITMFDVLEHLSSPLTALKKAASLLTADGLLVIWTCDQGSLFSRLCGRFWHFYNPPQHLSIFSQKVLISFLRQAGLTPVTISKKGKWFSFAYLLHLTRTIQRSKTADLLFKVIQNSPLNNLLFYLRFNDSMVIYAKKEAA